MRPRTLAFTIHDWARRALHRDEIRGFTVGYLTVTWFGDSLIGRMNALRTRLDALHARFGGGR